MCIIPLYTVSKPLNALLHFFIIFYLFVCLDNFYLQVHWFFPQLALLEKRFISDIILFLFLGFSFDSFIVPNPLLKFPVCPCMSLWGSGQCCVPCSPAAIITIPASPEEVLSSLLPRPRQAGLGKRAHKWVQSSLESAALSYSKLTREPTDQSLKTCPNFSWFFLTILWGGHIFLLHSCQKSVSLCPIFPQRAPLNTVHLIASWPLLTGSGKVMMMWILWTCHCC